MGDAHLNPPDINHTQRFSPDMVFHTVKAAQSNTRNVSADGDHGSNLQTLAPEPEAPLLTFIISPAPTPQQWRQLKLKLPRQRISPTAANPTIIPGLKLGNRRESPPEDGLFAGRTTTAQNSTENSTTVSLPTRDQVSQIQGSEKQTRTNRGTHV